MKKQVMAMLLTLCLSLAGCGSDGQDGPEPLLTVDLNEETDSGGAEEKESREAASGPEGQGVEAGGSDGEMDGFGVAASREEGSGSGTASAGLPSESQEASSEQSLQEPEILNFVDVFGQEYQVEIRPEVEKHDYDLAAFSHTGDYLEYTGDPRYSFRLGVDVSEHQGAIDWEKVRADGYEFAFIRIGYRGYGTAGKVCQDKFFVENLENARAAGLDVGIYFFSQAVSEEEARQEAEFVLQNLGGCELQLPVVYDPEHILDAAARTDDVTGEQFTKNTILFCEMIREAGYEPMIYSNMLWEAYQFDLEQLAGYPIWYADYEPLPQTPYHFVFWQYTNEGRVDGMAGDIDLDIQLMPVGN